MKKKVKRISKPKPNYDEIHLEYYDKEEMDKYLNHIENKHGELVIYDTKTNKEWRLDFVFVAFPGLKSMGYRVEGFHQTGTTKDGIPSGEIEEFGTIIIHDGELKVIQW
jgi:hypothetical protein